ncbi:extensin-like [Cryptomeria japonica]|uniref:extensin-like n=1 Tax=Cryptomeria japonica TaxID=3369 RepID=UPI0027DA681B|nr:extensin-like [Cryptomeria japonica]
MGAAIGKGMRRPAATARPPPLAVTTGSGPTATVAPPAQIAARAQLAPRPRTAILLPPPLLGHSRQRTSPLVGHVTRGRSHWQRHAPPSGHCPAAAIGGNHRQWPDSHRRATGANRSPSAARAPPAHRHSAAATPARPQSPAHQPPGRSCDQGPKALERSFCALSRSVIYFSRIYTSHWQRHAPPSGHCPAAAIGGNHRQWPDSHRRATGANRSPSAARAPPAHRHSAAATPARPQSPAHQPPGRSCDQGPRVLAPEGCAGKLVPSPI